MGKKNELFSPDPYFPVGAEGESHGRESNVCTIFQHDNGNVFVYQIFYRERIRSWAFKEVAELPSIRRKEKLRTCDIILLNICVLDEALAVQ